MKIHLGCELSYDLPQPTPMIAVLNVHYSRFGDLEQPDRLVTVPSIPIQSYRDIFGNWCNRFVAPAGRFTLGTDGIIHDGGDADPIGRDALQHAVQDLPAETLGFLLASRYCETDLLSNEAWRLFKDTPPGWARVQAVCDFVHDHVTFGYEHSRATRTAAETYAEEAGVCRDFTHLAITFCRCLTIPARYCTGYISDIGVPPPHSPMDFAAWMEVYLGGRWWVFDPRNNTPRIGRILIAQGRDAGDVPLTHTFGANQLVGFRVWTDGPSPSSFEQGDDQPMIENKKEFATSSNGDSWFLCRDEGTAHGYVLHQANLPSSGTVTRVEIGDFLRRGPTAPEHLALLRLIGTLADDRPANEDERYP